MKNLRLKGRIVRLLILSVICISSSLLGLSYYFTNKATQSSVTDELTSTSNLVSAVLDSSYPGTWALNGEKLTKGKNPLHDIVGIIDKVKEQSNSEVTIFANDTRFITTLIVDNKRNVGTKADEKVIEIVLKNGEEFQSQVTISGVKYIGKYTPIKNGKNEIVGMIFVGKEYAVLMKPLTESIVYMVGCTIIVAILMIILGGVFASRVAKPISISVKALKRVSSGDLTEDIPSNLSIRKDEAAELAEAVGDMQNFLNNIVNNIKSTTSNMFNSSSNLLTVSENMTAASSNITHAIGEMASGTVGQAEDISDISQSLNEFGNKIQEAKEATSMIHDGSIEIEKMTNENNVQMKMVVDSIGNVKEQFDEFANSVSILGSNITRVDEITGVINSIADQTNLLALNAAIEAARAGESGKGFAVVADEIRKLAEESRKSSESIKELVAFIAKDTYKIVDNSKEVNNKLAEQLEAINKTLGSFEGITKSVSDIIPKINQVDKNSESINESKTTLISKAENAASIAEEISAATEEIAASSEEMASSAIEVEKVSEVLNLETKKLIDYVSIFKSK